MNTSRCPPPSPSVRGPGCGCASPTAATVPARRSCRSICRGHGRRSGEPRCGSPASRSVTADPGEVREVDIWLAARAFQHWSVDGHGWRTEPGAFRLSVGPSAGDRRLAADIIGHRSGRMILGRLHGSTDRSDVVREESAPYRPAPGRAPTAPASRPSWRSPRSATASVSVSGRICPLSIPARRAAARLPQRRGYRSRNHRLAGWSSAALSPIKHGEGADQSGRGRSWPPPAGPGHPRRPGRRIREGGTARRPVGHAPGGPRSATPPCWGSGAAARPW